MYRHNRRRKSNGNTKNFIWKILIDDNPDIKYFLKKVKNTDKREFNIMNFVIYSCNIILSLSCEIHFFFLISNKKKKRKRKRKGGEKEGTPFSIKFTSINFFLYYFFLILLCYVLMFWRNIKIYLESGKWSITDKYWAAIVFYLFQF